jgi:hypothetical protein
MRNISLTYAGAAALLGITLSAALSSVPARAEHARLAAAPASSAIKPLAERIAGTWLLVSFYDEDETGEEIERWGTEPKGRLSFDDHGRFAFQLQDNLGFRLCAAYSGTYRITEARINFRPDTWAAPGNDEIDHVADVMLKGDILDLTSSMHPSLAGSAYSHTRWQRLPDAPDTRAKTCGR